jgi:hypothetical protein
MFPHAAITDDGGQFDRWIGQDPPGTSGNSVQSINLGIEIVVGTMIVFSVIMFFAKKK